VCTNFEMLKVEVPIIFLGTVGFSPRRDKRYCIHGLQFRTCVARSENSKLGLVVTDRTCFCRADLWQKETLNTSCNYQEDFVSLNTLNS
jgi:hypothetical protein